MKKKLDHRFWAKYFQVYDVLNMVIPYQELLDTIVKELDIKEGDFILDAGCGTGNLASKMSNKGAKVIGIDYSKEALEIAKNKKIKNFELIQHDLTKKLPFPDNHFDKIVSNNVIYSLPEEIRPQVFKEFRRVLERGGKIIISNPIQNARPTEIYKEHLKLSKEKDGITLTMIGVLNMVWPTIKIFHYNNKIRLADKKKQFTFFNKGEQRALLIGAGLISEREFYIYSKQGLLAIGEKNDNF